MQGTGTPRPRTAGAAAAQQAIRCALCRLDDRRRGQSTMQRVWLGVVVAALLFLIALDFAHNHVQGIAFLVLAVVLLATAFAYSRYLKRQ